jgi:hypothetical protein
MNETNQRKLNLGLLIGILFFALLSQCNSRSAKNYADTANKKIDSMNIVISHIKQQTDEIPNVYRAIKVEGLKTEKRTLLNTNQIFLTKKRPDERVIEIDKELDALEK